MSKETFISNAQWPLETYRGFDGSGVSVDTHQTREQAEAVCRGLQRGGFGGMRKSFPLRTWVSEANQNEQSEFQ